MTTLTPNAARRLILAHLSAKALKESMQLLAKPSGGHSVVDPLLAEHAEEMLLDIHKLVTKLGRLAKLTETDLPFLLPPKFEELTRPEAEMQVLVDELASLLATQ